MIYRAFHDCQQDTGRVGTASELSLARRVQLAVVAHIRHMYTDYDHLLRHVDWQTARAMVEQRSLDIIARWMNEDDDPDAVEDILREVIVIPDDDDDGVAKEARTRDGDPTQCTSSGEIEIVSNLAADDLETRALDYGAKDGSPSQFDSPASEKAEAAQYQGRGQYVHINPRPLNLHRSEQIGQHRQRAWEEALSRRRNPDQAAPQRLRPFPGSADQISHPHYTRPLAGSQVPLQSDNGNRLIYIGSRPHTQAPVYQTIAPSHPESLISQRPVQRIGLGGRSLSGHVSVAAPNGVDLHRPIRYYQHEQQLSSNPREYRPEHVYIPQREEDLPNQSNARRPKTPETIIPSIEGTSRSVPDPTLEANRQKLPDYTSNRERAYQNIVRHPEPVTNLRHEYHEDQAQSKRRRTEYLPSHGEQPTRMQDYVREGGSILIPLEGTASSFKSQHSLPYYEGKPQSLELRNVSSVTTLREADPRYQQTLRPRPQQAFFVQPHTLHAQETSQRKNDMSPFNSVKRASYPYPVIPLEVEGTQSRSRDHIQEPTSTIWTEFQSPHARRELEFSPRSPHASADEQYWFREGPQTLAIAGASQQGPERLISQPQPIETFRGNGQPLASVRNIRGHQQTGSWDSRPADAHDLRRGGSPAPSPLQNLQNLHIVQPSSQGVKREWPSQSHHKPEIFPSYPTVPTSTHYPSQPAPHVQPNGSQDRRNRDRRFLDHNTPYRSQQYAPEAPLGLQLSSQSQARQPPAMYPSSEQPQIHRRTIDPRSGREIIVLE
ncbi:hypothetical protein MMC25_006505 [Agyrium rufum]|nr:hypothetical protein [Agyrium rufum]